MMNVIVSSLFIVLVYFLYLYLALIVYSTVRALSRSCMFKEKKKFLGVFLYMILLVSLGRAGETLFVRRLFDAPEPDPTGSGFGA